MFIYKNDYRLIYGQHFLKFLNISICIGIKNPISVGLCYQIAILISDLYIFPSAGD